VENAPLSPRAPLTPVGRLTAYGKLAFGHLPTGLGKPAAGFPQPPSFDDDPSLPSMHISNCRHRTKVVDAGHIGEQCEDAGLMSPAHCMTERSLRCVHSFHPAREDHWSRIPLIRYLPCRPLVEEVLIERLTGTHSSPP